MKTKQEIIESYNRLAGVYSAQYCDELDGKPFDRELLRSFVRESPAGHPICDLGCGPGHVANHLASLDARAIGVDLSPGMVDAARGRYPAIEYRVGDMLALDIPSGSLGAVVCFYAIIHLERDQLDTAVGEMYRVVMPGGNALLSCHRGKGDLHEEESLGLPIPFDCTLFEPEEITEAMKRAGFEISRLDVRAPYPHEYPTTRIYVWGSKPGGLSER